jgi:hypothetical protein
MPKVRELVIDGEIFKNIPKAIERFGGTYMLMYRTLRSGEHLYLGHHVEYLRDEPIKLKPIATESPLDRAISRMKRKPRVKIKKRFPLLERHHVVTNFGLYRDQLIYR